jgi:hypothetical protein
MSKLSRLVNPVPGLLAFLVTPLSGWAQHPGIEAPATPPALPAKQSAASPPLSRYSWPGELQPSSTTSNEGARTTPRPCSHESLMRYFWTRAPQPSRSSSLRGRPCGAGRRPWWRSPERSPRRSFGIPRSG